MTLTREQIEELRERSKDDRGLIVGSEVRQLCTMALNWLAVQPRPIEEAPKDGTPVLVYQPDDTGQIRHDCTAWPKGWTGKWPTEYMAYSGGPPTHFIPLSSLPEPKI